MRKFEVEIQTFDMETKSKPVIVELEHDVEPSPNNIIYYRLLNYYQENKEELNLYTTFNIAWAAFNDANEMVKNLCYYNIKEIK